MYIDFVYIYIYIFVFNLDCLLYIQRDPSQERRASVSIRKMEAPGAPSSNNDERRPAGGPAANAKPKLFGELSGKRRFKKWKGCNMEVHII